MNNVVLCINYALCKSSVDQNGKLLRMDNFAKFRQPGASEGPGRTGTGLFPLATIFRYFRLFGHRNYNPESSAKLLFINAPPPAAMT
ncbi:hypothetical protein CEXT_786291 [Caerostris extrusa]|uniref:Uncharacterized protein n=1 Tax=Caerostris extrusa TaxID=172846 RepID=A0AAV4TRA9_CAEEX|nr:hypothetical protein CEXT_786291 [Caerostris extrusa]